MMNNRERFLATMRYEPVDRRPLSVVGAWPDTLARWRREGLPEGVDPNEYLGLDTLKVTNISHSTACYPEFATRTIEEDDHVIISIDGYGRTVRDFKDQTTMPEWLDFPVKTPDDLAAVVRERFSLDLLEERFPDGWEDRVRAAGGKDAVVLIDGGCYYWNLRSLTGVETASYMLYDAYDIVDELFENINTIVLEGIRRASKLVKIDCIGFGEDIAFKTGPLVSPAMFRKLILPRYKKSMDLARSLGIEMTWYDSDGNLRQLIDDYFSVGINCLAPCEVAADMQPNELRRDFGRELRMVGGVDKREIARGKASIDAEIKRLRPIIEEGGYVPSIDHSVSSDISWDDYQYFIDRLRIALGE